VGRRVAVAVEVGVGVLVGTSVGVRVGRRVAVVVGTCVLVGASVGVRVGRRVAVAVEVGVAASMEAVDGEVKDLVVCLPFIASDSIGVDVGPLFPGLNTPLPRTIPTSNASTANPPSAKIHPGTR